MQFYPALLIRLLQFVEGETEITTEELQELRLDMQVIFVFTTFRLMRNQFNAIRSVNVAHCT